MFIQTEQTPNPATLKFLPGMDVTGSRGPVDIARAADAGRSPLAEALFGIEGVTGVFLGADFVSVTKSDGHDWAVLKPPILGVIMDHFTQGRPVLSEAAASVDDEEGDDDEVVVQIKELLDTRVRPAVAMDGGDIVFRHFEDGVVYLQMHGACAGCPSSTATLKMGIENMLRHYIPEVQSVQPVP